MFRLILIDDESQIGLLMNSIFRKEKIAGTLDFSFFNSAQEAMDYLKKTPTSPEDTILLTDLNMPEMSGLELLKFIQQNYPQITTGVVSGYSDEEMKTSAAEVGAKMYFVKPVNLREIKSSVEKFWIQQNKATEAA